jgi:hypothetical protein
MKKQSHGTFKRWQTRFFVVQGHYLKYYEAIGGDVKGTIDLANLRAVCLTFSDSSRARGQHQGEDSICLAFSESTELLLPTGGSCALRDWVDTLRAFAPAPGPSAAPDVSPARPKPPPTPPRAAGQGPAPPPEMVTLHVQAGSLRTWTVMKVWTKT